MESNLEVGEESPISFKHLEKVEQVKMSWVEEMFTLLMRRFEESDRRREKEIKSLESAVKGLEKEVNRLVGDRKEDEEGEETKAVIEVVRENTEEIEGAKAEIEEISDGVREAEKAVENEAGQVREENEELDSKIKILQDKEERSGRENKKFKYLEDRVERRIDKSWQEIESDRFLDKQIAVGDFSARRGESSLNYLQALDSIFCNQERTEQIIRTVTHNMTNEVQNAMIAKESCRIEEMAKLLNKLDYRMQGRGSRSYRAMAKEETYRKKVPPDHS